jgi:hypothetical protein
MAAPVFKTAAGRLTPYAFACGYQESRALAYHDDARVTLWNEGGPLYHVRAHDRANGRRLFWASTESIRDARALYDMAETIADAIPAA